MTFNQAKNALLAGEKVTRAAWEGDITKQFIFASSGPKGGVYYGGTHIGYYLSVEDMKATDWYRIPTPTEPDGGAEA